MNAFFSISASATKLLFPFQIQVVMVQKAIAFCGSTPENFAKVMMIENQLSKRGAQSRHIADALKKLAGFDKRAEIVEKLKNTVVEEKVSFMKIYNASLIKGNQLKVLAMA